MGWTDHEGSGVSAALRADDAKRVGGARGAGACRGRDLEVTNPRGVVVRMRVGGVRCFQETILCKCNSGSR